MAGVVAMASVIKDFDTQPCKKSRKDGGSLVVKTITNYFSPVVKPVEKPFSPPRSNNIMDYFKKKTPPSNEKSTSPEQAKENYQWAQSVEKHTEAGKQQQQQQQQQPPPQKRGKKASKAARKLVSETTVSSKEDTCVIVEHESKDSEVVSSRGVLGSDTAALLAQFSAETETSESNPTVMDECKEEDKHQEDGLKSDNSPKLKPVLNTTELSPVIPSSDEVKHVKIAARNTRKRQQQVEKHLEVEEREAERSLSEVSMEVNLDEVSQLNSSTVTISFEDFVRSQSQDMSEEEIKHEEGKQDETEITTGAEEMEIDTNQPNSSQTADDKDSGETSVFHDSPRTLKIQAEVHTSSTQQEKSMATGKVASIFSRRKGSNCPAEVNSPPHTQDGDGLPSPTVKRKSNVVLQEEDLELLVLESESTPKCSEAERKQFMSMFKQPNLDRSKTKPAKSQGKQKQTAVKVLDVVDKVGEGDSVSQLAAEEVSKGPEEKKAAKKKPTRRKAKQGKEEVKVLPAAVEEPAAAVLIVDDDKKEEPLINSTPTAPALRRSRREALVRQAPETSSPSSRKTRKPHQSKEDVVAPLLQESPVQMSTPKTRKSKHGIFVAEIVCPPDAQESPIRIKFTRVHQNVSKVESGRNSSLSPKTTKESKKRKQAKKLVEKAKVIQQSQKTSVKEKDNLRRSLRNEASMKRSYCEDEDSVICVEEDQATTQQRAPEKSKVQKPLRSLNDVLGKTSQAAKETKAPSGSKASSRGLEKTTRKPSTVISIFDEGSREGSDKSQDDEQFRARMKFLKSGLPESFKKQMAKTAATKEAYAVSCSSFQPVTHIMQPPSDCRLWSLPWPESLTVCHLKELWNHQLKPLPSVSGSLCVRTVPHSRSSCHRGSSQRPEISESVRQLLLEEFRKSNPHFPAQIFISRLLKRQQLPSTSSDPEAVTRSNSLPVEPVGVKRKRNDDGGNAVKVAKKQRSSHSQDDDPADPEPTRRGGRARRGQRAKLEEEKAKPSLQSAPIPPGEDSVLIVDDLLWGEDAGKKGDVVVDKITSDSVKEDVLWTEKYQPQHSSDIVDNSASVRRLHSWLKEWKLRADREERKKQKERKQEEGNSDWDGLEEDSWDGEDPLCNTVLITGPPGVGKTAAVYACAQELGFKVFEVNASSQRSGRLILSQLKEATQSHQVDSQGVNAHKPKYFNSYSTSGSSSAGSIRPGNSPRKINSPRRVVSSPRKHPQSPRSAKRGGLAPTSLANFFKMARPANKETHDTTVKEKIAASKTTVKGNETGSKTKELIATTPKEKSSEEQGKKTATSLILFEEVDVIFEDDSGFLAAIKTFMTTTKRPVILTTSDPAFSTMFDGKFEEILFKVPSVMNVSSYLRLLCVAENVRTDLTDVSSLLRLNGCDIRQSLLQLQFWTRSAGGCNKESPSVQTDINEVELKPENEADQPLPPCDTRCTESKLGLLNIENERDIWQLLQSNSLVEEAVCWDLLTECRRQRIDLIYSNMQTLLPLPLTQLTTSSRKPEQYVSASLDPKEQPSSSTQQAETAPSHPRLFHMVDSGDSSDRDSPVKVSNRMRKKKRRNCNPDQDGLHSDSDSEDGFLSLCKPLAAPQTKMEVQERLKSERLQRKPLTAEEREKNVPVSQSLESIADFLDDMSYMDSSLLLRGDNHRQISCAGAVVKDGMTDEVRTEADRGSWQTGSCAVDIHAAVEALSFHRCRASVAEAWNKAQQLDSEMKMKAVEELSLPVAAHQKGPSFTQDGPVPPTVVQQRREVMESLQLRVFGSLSNRPAAAVDYSSFIRTICRSEQLKEQGKVKRRFLHYLDAIHLGLEKSTLQLLAEDFP